jgi:NitT/TauT family transport system substrate-binding protein
LRVAYQPNEFGAQALYAREMGFFTKAGLNVELTPSSYSAATASAVASNAVDVGEATVITLAIAHSKKIPFVIIAPAAEFIASRQPTGWLMVGNQTSIRNAKDMNGKTIGTPGLATMGDFGVRAWVDLNGGDSTTLKFQEMPFSQMPAAFAAGIIDAAFVGEPYATAARSSARPLAREMDALGSQYVITVWFVMAPWAAAHPDLVDRFAAAMREASAWAQKNPAKCIEILARDLKIDATAFSADRLAVFPQRITPALIEAEVAITAKYGKFPPFPAEELIYTRR